MPEDKKMLCLHFDKNNLEFSYLVGLSIWLPAIALVYGVLKFLLYWLTHPKVISLPREGEIELAKNTKFDDEKKYSSVKDRGQQTVQYRFRQRQKKVSTSKEESDSGVLDSKLVANEEDSRVPDGDLKHFSHRHPLLRFHLRGTENIRCNICTFIISGVAYGCNQCCYFLHEVCSNIPKRIRHNFHPMHSLTLSPIPSIALCYSKVESELLAVAEKRGFGTEFHCVACGYYNSYPQNSHFAFYYHCDVCNFDLHLECASVPTTLIHKVKYPLDLFTIFPLENEGAAVFCDICNQVMNRESSWVFYNREFDYICHFECGAEEEFGLIGNESFLSQVQKLLLLQTSFPGQKPKVTQLGEVKHFSHRHPLKAIKQMNEASIMSCCICSSKYSCGYICQQCNYFIDEICFTLPPKIRHHYHLNHTLVLASYTDHPNIHCTACRGECRIAYYCSASKFSLHRTCAGAPMTLTLGTNKKVSYTISSSIRTRLRVRWLLSNAVIVPVS